MPDQEEGLVRSRQIKLNRLRRRGIDPYPPRFKRSCDVAAAITRFEAKEQTEDSAAPADHLALAGRIMSIRTMGRAAFLDLRDSTGTIQTLLRQNLLGEEFDLIKDLDLGDHLGVIGPIMYSRTGQLTIEAHRIVPLSKGIRPLPEKWHGLRDVEIRYRQRYLDLIANPVVMETFVQRGRIINRIRAFLDRRGFLEVETPILVPVAAGAHARPFMTHHHALDQQLYLRIATELYLKRLIVGGFDKVYEIGRVFRNEGIDQDHNPEFTLLESYEAYADYNDVMELVETMVSEVAQEVRGTMKLPLHGHIIDFSPPWQRVRLQEELLLHGGIDLDAYPDDSSLANRVIELGLNVDHKETRGRVIEKLVATFLEPRMVQPTFVMDYPEIMSPLAKAKPNTPGYVERFEAFAGGMEIANAYTELNDPQEQRARFEVQDQLRQISQDEELDRKDVDFLLAMEHGMPPTGGLGMGIDRLVMLLTGQPTIRDVVLFPQMRSIQHGPTQHTAE
jgi:lysyl-tRNA synthetase class 2